jgi:hypothetical protein
MKAMRILALMVALSGLGACSNMTRQEQRMLSGGAIGAVGGAALVAATGGSWVIGGLIGAGAGTVAGALIR